MSAPSVLQHVVGGLGGGQQLSSPGSCLTAFRPNLYIECNSRGHCHYFSNKYSHWLYSVAPATEEFTTQTTGQTIKAEHTNYISRCAVCELERKEKDTSSSASSSSEEERAVTTTHTTHQQEGFLP